MGYPENGDYNKTVFPSNIPIMIWYNRESESYPLHWHRCAEIVMPMQGKYDIQFRNKHYHLEENDILIIPPRELHQINVPAEVHNGKRMIMMFT